MPSRTPTIRCFKAKQATNKATQRARSQAGIKPGDVAYKWQEYRAGKPVYRYSAKYPRRSQLLKPDRAWREVYLAQEMLVDCDGEDRGDVAMTLDAAVLMVSSVLRRYVRHWVDYPDRKATLERLLRDLRDIGEALESGADAWRMRWKAIDLCWDEP